MTPQSTTKDGSVTEAMDALRDQGRRFGRAFCESLGLEGIVARLNGVLDKGAGWLRERDVSGRGRKRGQKGTKRE